jgi:uncharacterized membrane protein YvbJ
MIQFCPKCGTKNIDEAVFCKNCGFNLQEAAVQLKAEKEKSTKTVSNETKQDEKDAEEKRREETAKQLREYKN